MNTVLTNTFVQFHRELGTRRDQLEEMRDRIFDRMTIRRQEIRDLHEIIASDTCAVNGMTLDEAMGIIVMLSDWCDMDEDRIYAIDDLLGR